MTENSQKQPSVAKEFYRMMTALSFLEFGEKQSLGYFGFAVQPAVKVEKLQTAEV